MSLAPVVLFVYNRLAQTKHSVESLARNDLAKETDLFIFSDGPKSHLQKGRVEMVRNYIGTLEGEFKSIAITYRNRNLGLAKSVISGISEIFSKYNKVIVLEDDLISSPNFLNYMNQTLDYYTSNDKIFSISGYSFPLMIPEDYKYSVYFLRRASSYGWGTWKNRWDGVDWEVKSFTQFISNKKMQKRFNLGGPDLTRMLKKQMDGKIDSWAIRWCFNQFMKNQLTVYPTQSKIQDIGYGKDATHVNKYDLFHTYLDPGKLTNFVLPTDTEINPSLEKQFRYKFSYINKAKHKLKSIINF